MKIIMGLIFFLMSISVADANTYPYQKVRTYNITVEQQGDFSDLENLYVVSRIITKERHDQGNLVNELNEHNKLVFGKMISPLYLFYFPLLNLTEQDSIEDDPYYNEELQFNASWTTEVPGSRITANINEQTEHNFYLCAILKQDKAFGTDERLTHQCLPYSEVLDRNHHRRTSFKLELDAPRNSRNLHEDTYQDSFEIDNSRHIIIRID